MSECIQQAGLGCSYVNVTTNDGNVTVFTWWLTLGRDHETDTMAIMEFTVLIIIMLIALIANLLVFVVIMSDKKMKKIPTHQYMGKFKLLICSLSNLLNAAQSHGHFSCKTGAFTLWGPTKIK